MRISIQGDEGSFNEEATIFYCNENQIPGYEIDYAITTDNVLKEVCDGKSEFGIFAIYNNNSGIVEESIEAISRYNFSVVKSFELPIRQCFHVKPEMTIEKIKRVISHPQALAQCSKYLNRYFKNAKLVEGVDTAKEVQNLMDGKYDDQETAIIASKICEEKYGSKILVDDIQNSDGNTTCFCVVSSYGQVETCPCEISI